MTERDFFARCVQCRTEYEVDRHVGQWACRMHARPLVTHATTTPAENYFPCCGLRPHLCGTVRDMFYGPSPEQVRGCCRADHTPVAWSERSSAEARTLVRTYRRSTLVAPLPEAIAMHVADWPSLRAYVADALPAGTAAAIVDRETAAFNEAMWRESLHDTVFYTGGAGAGAILDDPHVRAFVFKQVGAFADRINNPASLTPSDAARIGPRVSAALPVNPLRAFIGQGPAANGRPTFYADLIALLTWLSRELDNEPTPAETTTAIPPSSLLKQLADRLVETFVRPRQPPVVVDSYVVRRFDTTVSALDQSSHRARQDRLVGAGVRYFY
jgi:hypothetical protein